MQLSLSSLSKPVKWLYNEFGMASLVKSGRDAWLVILARTSRMFAFGAASLVIALFFAALKFSDEQIGLFMTLTLAGDVLLSLFLSLIADRVGRRRILLAGSILMAVSGVVFAMSENFWLLLFAAVVGVVSTTGGDFGPFRAIEESTLSNLTTPEMRSDVLSWYVTTSSLGSALGTAFSGHMVDFLSSRDSWSVTDAYHAVFWMYVVVGVLAVAVTLEMSERCELGGKDDDGQQQTSQERGQQGGYEMVSRNGEEEDENHEEGNNTAKNRTIGNGERKRSLFAQISAETRSVMYKLWFLLGVDSIADGMVSYALTTYYVDLKFHLAKAKLGYIMSSSYLLMACSTIFAGPLSKRLGLINTMVFTHIPSSAAVLLFPMPQNVPLTVALFFLRTGLNNMDQAPRVALIAAVVRAEERTAVMGITSMLRTFASAVGPTFTGLLGNDHFWIAFVVAGSLRLCYDFGLFFMFINMKLYVHETNDRDDHGEGDEEIAMMSPRASSMEERRQRTMNDER